MLSTKRARAASSSHTPLHSLEAAGGCGVPHSSSSSSRPTNLPPRQPIQNSTPQVPISYSHRQRLSERRDVTRRRRRLPHMAWTRLACRLPLPSAPRRLRLRPTPTRLAAGSATAGGTRGSIVHPASPSAPATPPLPTPARVLGVGRAAPRRPAARGDVGRCFASEASAAPAGETAAELVEVPLAQTGEGIAECELLRWFVTEGDQVDEFQPLCEVQSDKTTIEITSRFKGKVHQIHFGPGDIVKVGETLLKMIVGDSHVVSHDDIAPPTDKSLGVDSTHPSGEGNIPSGTLSTPAVRHLAKQCGLSINDIQGTGKDGRVLKEDVLNYAVSKGLCKESSVSEENIGPVELLEEGKSLLDVH